VLPSRSDSDLRKRITVRFYTQDSVCLYKGFGDVVVTARAWHVQSLLALLPGNMCFVLSVILDQCPANGSRPVSQSNAATCSPSELNRPHGTLVPLAESAQSVHSRLDPRAVSGPSTRTGARAW
jgi:hypothetical protein